MREHNQQDVLCYVRERFSEATVIETPFPNLVIRDVLPDDLYRRMKADLPSSAEWFIAAIAETLKFMKGSWKENRMIFKGRPVSAIKNIIGIAQHRIFQKANLIQPTFAVRNDKENKTSSILSRFSRRWKNQYQQYIDLIDTLTREKFEPFICEYLNELCSQGLLKHQPNITWRVGVFCLRTKGWAVTPHTHALNQLIQSMVYFPLPESTLDQGTIYYRIKQSRHVNATELFHPHHYNLDEVESVFQVPYFPNTLVSILNTPTSIHGTLYNGGSPRRYIFTGPFVNGISPPDHEKMVLIKSAE